ncbi:bacillithiol biosynthesis cysteine-adding enzyme BshC [Oceanobacillus halophilus]|uniref:Putative cysteine ligase BshC n=1 Tax=Oceanobacillus halophilus TaxID=930130 RepID=A0A495ACP1_9BACI|nr:bacillithiol biosynthesis cysteine-adding enzyme BshC [Oceanobacillus halophilus]RKQ37390.1 bacillithiol biosynthesis cysteine-adding enzyme BshC [Oceanobacillus halophilus]
MRIDPIRISNQNKLVSDYRQMKDNVMEFFDYSPFSSFEQRVNDLKRRNFDRIGLTEVLHKINKEWSAPKSTLQSIERLKDTDSVVVVAGQQAGLLTGPMYTINKIISILQLAKQRESKQQIPVVPVFWIAGEDHDFDEINHIYLPEESRMRKYKVKQQGAGKSSVSHIGMDKEEVTIWLNQLFTQLEEAAYTNELYTSIMACLEQSRSYTDFFARLIFQLFPDEGLVLMDSAHPLVRELEKSYFVQLIEKQSLISSEVNKTLEKLKAYGYSVPLDVDENSANLFYHRDNERVLLMRNSENNWVGKQNEVVLSTKELIRIAENKPELLSNNVVTRPLMQELLFPTLAFVGGPGEISYWSALKPVFESFNIKMPPVLPRLSFTYIDRKVEKVLERFDLSIEPVVNHGLENYKHEWLKSKSEPPIQDLADQLKKAIETAHAPIRDLAQEIRSDIGELAEKNLDYLYKDVEFIEGRIIKAVEEKYKRELRELDYIQLTLRPDGFQERTWNPLPFINKYGLDFIKATTNYECSFSEEHYLVYL